MLCVSLYEGALEKSVRASGLSASFAQKYATEALKKVPGKEKMRLHLSSVEVLCVSDVCV